MSPRTGASLADDDSVQEITAGEAERLRSFWAAPAVGAAVAAAAAAWPEGQHGDAGRRLPGVAVTGSFVASPEVGAAVAAAAAGAQLGVHCSEVGAPQKKAGGRTRMASPVLPADELNAARRMLSAAGQARPGTRMSAEDPSVAPYWGEGGGGSAALLPRSLGSSPLRRKPAEGGQHNAPRASRFSQSGGRPTTAAAALGALLPPVREALRASWFSQSGGRPTTAAAALDALLPPASEAARGRSSYSGASLLPARATRAAVEGGRASCSGVLQASSQFRDSGQLSQSGGRLSQSGRRTTAATAADVFYVPAAEPYTYSDKPIPADLRTTRAAESVFEAVGRDSSCSGAFSRAKGRVVVEAAGRSSCSGVLQASRLGRDGRPCTAAAAFAPPNYPAERSSCSGALQAGQLNNRPSSTTTVFGRRGGSPVERSSARLVLWRDNQIARGSSSSKDRRAAAAAPSAAGSSQHGACNGAARPHSGSPAAWGGESAAVGGSSHSLRDVQYSSGGGGSGSSGCESSSGSDGSVEAALLGPRRSRTMPGVEGGRRSLPGHGTAVLGALGGPDGTTAGGPRGGVSAVAVAGRRIGGILPALRASEPGLRGGGFRRSKSKVVAL